jgi:hypothetical protein
MTKYNPPQPAWKRGLAGFLDFTFVFFPLANLLSRLPGNPPRPPVINSPGKVSIELFNLSGTYLLVLIALTMAYFIIMNRTGGTVFQRLLRMNRSALRGAPAGTP